MGTAMKRVPYQLNVSVVRNRRDQLKMSDAGLAKRIGVGTRTLQYWLEPSMSRRPDIVQVERLAKVLGLGGGGHLHHHSRGGTYPHQGRPGGATDRARIEGDLLDLRRPLAQVHQLRQPHRLPAPATSWICPKFPPRRAAPALLRNGPDQASTADRARRLRLFLRDRLGPRRIRGDQGAAGRVGGPTVLCRL